MPAYGNRSVNLFSRRAASLKTVVVVFSQRDTVLDFAVFSVLAICHSSTSKAAASNRSDLHSSSGIAGSI